MSSVAACVSIADFVQRVTNFANVPHAIFFCLNGIKAGNPERGRWAHLAHSGSQSEHRIRFILPTSATSCITRKATRPTVAELKKGSKDPNVQDLMKVDKAIMSFPLVGYKVVFNSLLTASSEHRIDRIGRKKKKKKKHSRTYKAFFMTMKKTLFRLNLYPFKVINI